MPSNKEAFIRYRAINRCLINKGIASRDDLRRACSDATSQDVSWRTIAEDIRAMRQDDNLGFNAPIENVVGQGYRYSEPNYSIDRIPLRDEELRSLEIAARLFQEYSQVSLFNTISGAVERISQKVAIRLQENRDAGLDKIIEFESAISDGGSRLVDELIECIRHRIVVRVNYLSYSSGKRSNPLMHPYFLKEYRNRWYLVGWHAGYGQLRTLALERIETLTREFGEVYREDQFKAREYYRHAIGVSVNNTKPVSILLKVHAKEWPYISSQPWHESQRVIREGQDHVVFALRLIINYELRNLILSYGSSIQVVEPEQLRLDISNELKCAAQNYESNAR